MTSIVRVLAVALVALGVAGCATVTISSEGSSPPSGQPSWQDRKWFVLGGLLGDKHVDVRRACAGRAVAHMQSQNTFSDGLINFVTLGILSPRTAKVWCR